MPWQIEDYDGEASAQAVLDEMTVKPGVVEITVRQKCRAALLRQWHLKMLAYDREFSARHTTNAMVYCLLRIAKVEPVKIAVGIQQWRAQGRHLEIDWPQGIAQFFRILSAKHVRVPRRLF